MTEYFQKFQIRYTTEDGLPSNDIRALALERKQRLWVATSEGLSVFENDTWKTALSIRGITALHVSQSGEVWIGVGPTLVNKAGKAVFQLATGEIHTITEDSHGQIWIASDSQICCRVGNNWHPFDVPDEAVIRAIRLDSRGRLFIGTAAGLICCDSEGAQHYTDRSSALLSNDIRCLEIDAHGHVWIGTGRGVNIFDGATAWYAITGANGGLPYEDVHHIAFGEQGQRWIGTTRGVAAWVNSKWEYYASRRWLPSDHVTAVALQPNGTAWVGTPKGLARLEKRPYTLQAKAVVFQRRIQARHNRYGFVTGCFLERPGDLNSYVHEASDNDGLWTALYIAAESFRYAVTGEIEAKALAQKSLKALMMLEEKSSIDGFPGRAVVRKGEERVIKSGGEWHDTPDGQWEWKADTSSDEIDGHIFGYSVYYDLVAGPAEKEQIRAVVGRIVSHIVDNDFLLIDVDGEHTRWGVWSPHYLNSAWEAQQGLNSLEMLAYLKTAYHITGDEKFQRAYLDLIEHHHYALNTINQKRLPPNPINHSDDELAFIAYYPLLKYETDPDLRAIYLLSLERSWQYERPERCPLWNFIYGALTGNPCDVEASLDTLQRIPMELICWSIKNSHRADIKFERALSRQGDAQSVEVLPPDERRVMRWNGNPYQLDVNSGGREEDDGTFFLLPYWLGRYHGLI